MEITEQRKNFYQEIGVNTADLKDYYINRAKYLINALKRFKDDKAIKYIEVLENYIKEPLKELKDVIDEYTLKNKVLYNDFAVNNTEFDIYYLDKELINFYLYGID